MFAHRLTNGRHWVKNKVKKVLHHYADTWRQSRGKVSFFFVLGKAHWNIHVPFLTLSFCFTEDVRIAKNRSYQNNKKILNYYKGENNIEKKEKTVKSQV